MINNNSGHLINISSGTGIVGLGNASIYSMSKSALQAFTESLNDELISKNINITNFFTGYLTNRNVDLISKKITKNIDTKKFNFFIRKYIYFSYLIKLFPNLKSFLKYFKSFFLR